LLVAMISSISLTISNKLGYKKQDIYNQINRDINIKLKK